MIHVVVSYFKRKCKSCQSVAKSGSGRNLLGKMICSKSGIVTLVAVLACTYASPALKERSWKTKTPGKGGFYGSRYGSVYRETDFEPDIPTTASPELLRSGQVPDGVAGPHQQNSNIFIAAEVPNIEEYTALPLLPASDDLIYGVKGGVKGGIKGVKGIKRPLLGLTTPRSISSTEYVPAITALSIDPSGAPPIRVTIQPNSIPVTIYSDNLVKKTKKGVKGGQKGYQYDTNPHALFSDSLVTDAPVEITTLDNYNPPILNLPTERSRSDVPVFPTEDYRQETVQQTELPVQQTEVPVQQTELPVQQTEEPYRETEPVTQGYLPTTAIPTTTDFNEPLQDTQSPIEPQITEGPEPFQTTVPPTTTEYIEDQQTELPQITQLPDQIVHTTPVPVYTTPVQTAIPTTLPPDEFAHYPLGPDGSHQIKGPSGGKSKGKGSKSHKVSRVNILIRGVVGVSSRRPRLDSGSYFNNAFPIY